MKQVLQNLKTGAIEVADLPTPICRPGHLLIATRRSLISAGTERMLVECRGGVYPLRWFWFGLFYGRI